MSSMVMKAGEVICIASGIYEGYDRTGPFVVAQDFDLEASSTRPRPPSKNHEKFLGLCMRSLGCSWHRG
jgi:hypothetical protein